MRFLPIAGALLAAAVGIGTALAAPSGPDVGCQVDGYLDGAPIAASPEGAVTVIANALTAEVPVVAEPVEAERARLIAAAASVVVAEKEGSDSSEFLLRDESGNTIHRFRVMKADAGWSVDYFSVSLPTALCAALAER